MMLYITDMNVSEVDLNLFAVLDAVLSKRSVTRAAEQLHVTQSAVSNSLARLREILADPLVVRNGRGLTLTPRAEQLAPMVAAGLTCLKNAVQGADRFLPEETSRTFSLAAADNQQVCDVPSIARRMAQYMPHAFLRVLSPDFLLSSDGLAAGSVDVSLGPAIPVEPPLFSKNVCMELGALVVRKDHPGVKRRHVTAELFNSLRHIDIEIAQGRPGTGHRMAEATWARQGLRRDIALTVPTFAAAALAASNTDYAAVIPLRTARIFSRMLPLKNAECAFELPSLQMAMFWHARTDSDEGARCFRQLILRSFVENR
jgi:DNA-binding transcriptional LysR family regulator